MKKKVMIKKIEISAALLVSNGVGSRGILGVWVFFSHVEMADMELL